MKQKTIFFPHCFIKVQIELWYSKENYRLNYIPFKRERKKLKDEALGVSLQLLGCCFL